MTRDRVPEEDASRVHFELGGELVEHDIQGELEVQTIGDGTVNCSERLQVLQLSAQVLPVLGALDGRPNCVGRDLERLDFGGRPFAERSADVESERSPPDALHHDRNDRHRGDVPLLEMGADVWREVANQAVDR